MMLTHLVVRPGLGSNKATIMSKSELDDILKFGTSELFKDDDTKDGGMVPTISIYIVKQKEEDVEVLKVSKAFLCIVNTIYLIRICRPICQLICTIYIPPETTDQDYWEKLLRHHYEQFREDEARELGKGKRIRKQVNYVDTGIEDQDDSGEH
ncbi:predicted protein, partial [Nematostella vectensis]